jgi:putative transposase
MNPVRARLVARAQDGPWTSARAHLVGADDELVKVAPLLARIDDFRSFLADGEDEAASRALRTAETAGRPLGDTDFIADLELILGRKLARGRPGPKPKPRGDQDQPKLWG